MGTQRIRGVNQIDPATLIGDLTSDGSALSSIRHNRAAIAAPTSGDDFSAGWAVGSLWIYGASVYICTGDGSWADLTSSSASAPAVHYVGKSRDSSTTWSHTFNTTNPFLVECFGSGYSGGTDTTYFSHSSASSGIGTSLPGVYRFDASLSGYYTGTRNQFFFCIGDTTSSLDDGSTVRLHSNEDDNWCVFTTRIVIAANPHSTTWYIIGKKDQVTADIYIRGAQFHATYLGPIP